MTKAKQQWKEEMERLNSKYNLDCFSDSELDSESDEGEQYHYEHGYETLIWEWKNIYEFVRLIFMKTSLSKTNLPSNFSKCNRTKIFNLSIVMNWYITYTCIHIQQIYRPENVQYEHTTFENFII